MSGKKKKGGHHDHEEHEEHVNHEAWVIPYADMLTLLMALFLVLFAIGRVDTEKFKALAESLHQSISGSGSGTEKIPIGIESGGATQSILNGMESMVPGVTVDTIPPPGEKLTDDAAKKTIEQQQQAVATAIKDLTGVEIMVQNAAAASGLGDKVSLRLEGRGLVVTIVTDQVMFADGKADLQPTGKGIIDVIADSLAGTEYRLAIEGHTDSRPISNARFPSNWELSTARATNVLRYLVDGHGFDPARLTASGFADTKPVDTSGTPEAMAKNRRVEIVILSDIVLTSVVGPSDSTPTTSN